MEHFVKLAGGLVGVFEVGPLPPGWSTSRRPKQMLDVPGLTAHEVPALVLSRGPVRLYLEPIGVDMSGTFGVFHLRPLTTAAPLVEVYHEDGRWKAYRRDKGFVWEPPTVVDAATRDAILEDAAARVVDAPGMTVPRRASR
jgi:hypothetical protein